MTKSAVEQRIQRLVGDGKLSGAGALPVSDAFRGTMEEILDNGKVAYQEIVKRITDEMHSKERRVFGIWGSWESLANDILAQLLDRKLIRPEHDPEDDHAQGWMTGMYWLLGEKIVTQKYYDVITKGEIKRATGNEAVPFRIILYDTETRYERDRNAKALTAIRKCRNELERLDRVDDQMSRMLDNMVAKIEGKAEKEVVSRPPASHLPDEPEQIVYCKFNGEPRALTQENFSQYLSRGRYYWRVTCKEHYAQDRARGTERRRQEVKETVERYIRMEGGEVPAVREIARRLGRIDDDRSVRTDWDVLTAAGELPPRVTN